MLRLCERENPISGTQPEEMPVNQFAGSGKVSTFDGVHVSFVDSDLTRLTHIAREGNPPRIPQSPERVEQGNAQAEE